MKRQFIIYLLLTGCASSTHKTNDSMLSKEEARTIALVFITTLSDQKPERPLVIVESAIIEKPYAWVFPITTEMHYETGDRQYAEPGLGPVVVNRQLRTAHSAPSSVPIETYLDYYQQTLKK